jgi:hypothetical protein
MTDEIVEALDVGPGGPCAGLLASIRTEAGEWIYPVTEARADGLTGAGTTAAIIDTGLSLDHPKIQQAVSARVDLTGEGEGDDCGHGTVVALIFLATAPDAKLVDVKALGRDAKASPAKLVEALDLVRNRPEIMQVNISAGVYRPWCSGKECDVCQAATRLTDAGTPVSAAAGNRPGLTACPAKAPDVFSIAELDPLMEKLTETSSPATLKGFSMPGGPYRVEVFKQSLRK